MAQINLGRIQPIDRGTYSVTYPYKKLDYVTNTDGTIYYSCIADVPAAGTPLTDTNYFRPAISPNLAGTDSAIPETLAKRDANGTAKFSAPTDPAHPALFGGVSIQQTASTSVTAATPTSYGMVTLDYTGATGAITLPSNPSTGGRVLIKKRNATMGAVNINTVAPKQWGAAQLRLYSDGDYWLLLWDGARWCLLDGYETGADGDGTYIKVADGTVNMITKTTGALSNPQFGSPIPNMYSYTVSVALPSSYVGDVNGSAGRSVDSSSTGIVIDAINGDFIYLSQSPSIVDTDIQIVWTGRWH